MESVARQSIFITYIPSNLEASILKSDNPESNQIIFYISFF